jgi:hypothetical protein
MPRIWVPLPSASVEEVGEPAPGCWTHGNGWVRTALLQTPATINSASTKRGSRSGHNLPIVEEYAVPGPPNSPG